ncbi:M55 family metallopeptidase [Microvirga sp. W0021]|uniref:M55 family metallopeptidase n=1 Tax=Hohaiivirga grylli TaxID=3133970 RepID=A0ABV0BNI2_9HYPH
MKVYISADIEGCAGVVIPEQTRPGNPEYERARRLMTEEVNAAIDGALRKGATEILVNDAHGPMVNLIPELLNPEAHFILGKPKPLNMFEGLDASFDAVFCIGFHTRASSYGVLAHTTNGFAFKDIALNGVSYGEAGLYGAYAGSIGVPVVLMSGDDLCLAENSILFPQAVMVETKKAIGNRAAANLPLEVARNAIRDGAIRALSDLGAMTPFVLQPPFELALTMSSPALADLTAIIPGAKRKDALTVIFNTESIEDAIRWVNTVSALSSFLR